MSLRRWIPILAATLVATSVVFAQPKADPKAPPPPPAGGTAGSAAGSAVEMTEDAPPSDMNGTDENPDAPRDTLGSDSVAVVAPAVKRPPGYPTEEALRPITLPQNMSEVAIGPHFQASPYLGSDALRARYGITRTVQIGLTYVMGGVFDDPDPSKNGLKFHAGKAVGLDLTVLLQNWVGIRVGVPMYIDPLAFGLQLGAPMKFVFNDKYSLQILEDLLTFKISQFAPSFYQEAVNATGAYNKMNMVAQSRGALRFSAYGVYQRDAKTSINGRFGVNFEDFSANKNNRGYGPATTFLRAGAMYTPRRYLDIGGSIGFDDLSKLGSFGPQFVLALRI